MNDFSKILDKAKELEAKMKESQQNLKKISVEGISGTGSIKVTLNGDGEMIKIYISPELLKEDKSIIEDFANSRQAIARHIFPENENSTGVKVFSKKADTLITKFESWQIAPSNPY